MGGGGTCKHVATLLLTWNAHPKEFLDIPDINQTLNVLDKSELIDLIKRMLRFEPELELILQPSEQDSDNPNIYEKHTDEVFRRNQKGWRGEFTVATEISAIMETGDSFIKKQQYAHGAAVYAGVATSIMKNLYLYPEEEDISPIINECVNGLAECLEHEGNDSIRLNILKALFSIFQKDMDEFGGICISDDIPEVIEKFSTYEECGIVITWIKDAREHINKLQYNDWSKTEYTNFLQQLEKKGN